MAMNGNTLGDAIKAAVQGAYTPTPGTPISDSEMTAIWRAIAAAIVSHIQTTAQVSGGPPGAIT